MENPISKAKLDSKQDNHHNSNELELMKKKILNNKTPREWMLEERCKKFSTAYSVPEDTWNFFQDIFVILKNYNNPVIKKYKEEIEKIIESSLTSCAKFELDIETRR